MMIVVDSRLAVVEMRRRNPLSVAVSEFYCPPAYVNHFMARLTSQSQPVDVCPAAAGLVVVVMNFGPICGDIAARSGAAALRREEDQSLVR
jgi:hypothetical protein